MIKKLLPFWLCCFALCMGWYSHASSLPSEQQLADFTNQTQWYFAVESNLLPEAGRFRGRIELENHSSYDLPAGAADWAWYFHSVRKIDSVEQHGLQLDHIQGDLHRIQPTADFAGLPGGEQLQLTFVSAPWIISYSDWMPRAFMVAGELTPAVFANTDTEDFSRFVRPMTEP